MTNIKMLKITVGLYYDYENEIFVFYFPAVFFSPGIDTMQLERTNS